MGERLVGRDAVEDSWRRILGRGSSMGFTVSVSSTSAQHTTGVMKSEMVQLLAFMLLP